MRCTDVSFRYQPLQPWIIQRFSCVFQPGVTLVKGASGCGKSTLLRLLAGFLKPQEGSVLTPSGSAPTDTDFQRRELGFVFQQLNLLPLATVRRNLALAASLAGLPDHQIVANSDRWRAPFSASNQHAARLPSDPFLAASSNAPPSLAPHSSKGTARPAPG